MNAELAALYQADQADRRGAMGPLTLWRDWRRRRRVRELILAGALQAPEDHYHAAMVCQHGLRLADHWQAHRLAKRAAELGYNPGRWLAAAAYDRWLMRQGKPQKYGTQYIAAGPRCRIWPRGKRYRLWDVDPSTTDAERAEWGVPPLAAAREIAEATGDLQASPRLGPTLASLEVVDLRVEVQDLSWARAAMPDFAEPRSEPLRAGENPEAHYLPPGCVCGRVGVGQGLVGGDGRVLATWRRYPVEGDQPFVYGWRWAEPPVLERVDFEGRTGIWIGGEAEGWSSLVTRASPAACWHLWGRLRRDELLRLALSLPDGEHASRYG